MATREEMISMGFSPDATEKKRQFTPEETAAWKAERAAARERKKEKWTSFSGNWRRKNALIFADYASKGALPMFGFDRKPGEDGKVRFTPPTVRAYGTGKSYGGINQLLLQKFAKELDWRKGTDGCYYTLTSNAAGAGNLRQGARKAYLVSTSFNDAMEVGDNSTRVYNLYSVGDVRDFSKVKDYGPMEYRKKDRNPDLEFDASSAKDAKEFIAQYLACSAFSGTFVTTPEKSQEVMQEISSGIGRSDNDMDIYQWMGEITGVSGRKGLVGKVVEEMTENIKKSKMPDIGQRQDRSKDQRDIEFGL